MSWSNEETHQIVERFWRNGAASCPNDNGPLKLRLRKLTGGDYDLLAECLYCGKSKELRRGDDPRRGEFRPWTGAETERLLAVLMRSAPPDCPVCGAKVERFDGAKNRLLIRCLRCGNSNQWRQISSLPRVNESKGPGPT